MSLMEAQDLGDEIRYETGAHVELRQIGNGEWVVFLDYRCFIWNVADWERFRQEGVA